VLSCFSFILRLPPAKTPFAFCETHSILWQNGGVNCPSCRSPVTSIIPSRAIQSLIDVYLRSVPSRTRLPGEREQADEIYAAGQSIRVSRPFRAIPPSLSNLSPLTGPNTTPPFSGNNGTPRQRCILPPLPTLRLPKRFQLVLSRPNHLTNRQPDVRYPPHIAHISRWSRTLWLLRTHSRPAGPYFLQV